MCDFLSWIEKDNELYYLTDKDVFSQFGREKLNGCKDNDFIGHGAIRVFHRLEGGVDREVRNFWKTELLPLELAEMVKNFDKHWGKMFKKYFMNDDLCCIIYHAPKEWQEKAWKQLLKQKPTVNDLLYIICHAPKEWQEKAWKQLLKQKHTVNDLLYIVYYAPKKWQEKARRVLKGRREP